MAEELSQADKKWIRDEIELWIEQEREKMRKWVREEIAIQLRGMRKD